MTRIILVVIAASVLLGVLFSRTSRWNENTPDSIHLCSQNSFFGAAYSLRSIPAGKELTLKDVGTVFTNREKIPPYAPHCSEDCIGAKLKHGVKKGQILSLRDFSYIPKSAILCMNSIEKDEIVTEGQIQHIWQVKDYRGWHDKEIIKDPDLVIGKRAKENIQPGTYLRYEQFDTGVAGN